MYKKVFLDANIFIDYGDENRGTRVQSIQVLTYLLQSNIKIYTSCDLITTIYYILAKQDRQKALLAIEKINTICTIIEFSNSDVSETLNLMQKNNNYHDLEDTLQYILALKSSCELIISNDQNFVSEEIEVLSTQKFMERFL